MSIIVPAGNKTVNWSPKEETKKVVTASAGAPEVQEEVSPLYLAAKKFDDAKAKKIAGLSDMGGSSASAGSSSSGSVSAAVPAGSSDAKSASGAKCPECGKSKSSAAPAPALKDSTEPVIEFDTDDGSSTLVGGEGASDDKGSSENLAGAVEELAEAVLDLKDAVQTDAPAAVDGMGDMGGGIGGGTECNDIGGMESPKSIEVEVKKDDGMGMDIPGTDVGHSEIVKKSNPEELCACAASKSSKLPWEKSDAKSGSSAKSSSSKSSSDTKAATEVGIDKKAAQSAASSSSDSKSSKSSSDTKATTEVGIDKAAKSEEFIKVAMLSPSNRKKLADYWVNMLGFPKDYVGLMVKDYEK